MLHNKESVIDKKDHKNAINAVFERKKENHKSNIISYTFFSLRVA